MNRSASHRASRKEWVGLAILALPCLLYSMDLTVLDLALPQISTDLKPTSPQLLWIVDIYGFVLAGSLITMGTLGDRIGRRRLLLIGAAAFGIGSVAAAYARSAELLIAARAVLGLAGATLAPSTLSLIRNMFLDPRQRTVAIGIWVSSYSAGAIVGPIIGGVLLESFWWGSVFLPAVPVMALLLATGRRLLPEFRDPDAGSVDVLSAVLATTIVLALVYGLKQFAQEGLGLVSGLVFGTGLVLSGSFVLRQRSLADPLIDPRFFRVPSFGAALLSYMLCMFVASGAFVFIYQYLQLVLGLSPLQAGLWTVPSFGAFLVGSLLVPLIARRVQPSIVMAGGMALSAIGYGLLTRITGTGDMALFVVSEVLSSLGLIPVVVLATDLVVGSAPPERAGVASAISETGAELGGALGIAVLGTLGATVYQHQMAGAIAAGLPPDVAAAARETLAGAVAAAGPGSDQLGAALLRMARQAFVQGLRIIATTSSFLAFVVAVIAAIMLRDVGRGAESELSAEAIDL